MLFEQDPKPVIPEYVQVINDVAFQELNTFAEGELSNAISTMKLPLILSVVDYWDCLNTFKERLLRAEEEELSQKWAGVIESGVMTAINEALFFTDPPKHKIQDGYHPFILELITPKNAEDASFSEDFGSDLPEELYNESINGLIGSLIAAMESLDSKLVDENGEIVNFDKIRRQFARAALIFIVDKRVRMDDGDTYIYTLEDYVIESFGRIITEDLFYIKPHSHIGTSSS